METGEEAKRRKRERGIEKECKNYDRKQIRRKL